MSFNTANELEMPQLSGPWRSLKQLNYDLLDPVYLAAVQAIEEAVMNAMFAAEDTPNTRGEGVYDPLAKSVIIED